MIIAPSRSSSRQYLAEFGVNGIGPQPGTTDSPHLDGEGAIVDHDASGEQRIGRNFALAGLVRAESRDVHPGSQMPAKYERLLGPGCRHDDVSASEGFIEIAGQCDIKTSTGRVVGKLAARLGHGVEDANGGERANAT
jgi:hypothetical protein